MELIWQLLYPVALYGIVSVCLFLAFPDVQPLLLQGISAAITAVILVPVYLRRSKTYVPSGRTRKPQTKEDAGRRVSLHAPAVFLLSVEGAAAAVCFNSLVSISGLMQLFPGFKASNAFVYAPPLWQQLLLAGCLIPVTEELVFRGLGFMTLRQRMGFPSAAALSAVLFGLYHGSVVQGIYAFFIGLVLAHGAEVCGCLSAAILIHVAANLMSIFFEAVGTQWIFESPRIFLVAAATGLCLWGSMRRLAHR